MRNRRHRIVFYLNDAEFECLKRKVAKTSLSRESFIRAAINGIQVKEAPPAEIPRFIREIRRIGSNINQLLMIANAKGLMDVPRLRQAISELRDVEKLIVTTYTSRR